jgi:AcrR family transcriptional regulator
MVADTSDTSSFEAPAETRRDQDTRQRIREVALELFAEQGYDGTSLRQIAERLGITKAALYYHFKSKDEIVTSVLESMLEGVDELIEWAQEQPRTAATRAEILVRYRDIVGSSIRAMHFIQQPGAGKQHPGEQFKVRIQALINVLVPMDAPFERRAKALLALMSLHIAASVESGKTPLGPILDVDPGVASTTMMAIAESLIADDKPVRGKRASSA